MWTRRDLDIVETLTRRVRVLSLTQISAIWWTAAGSHRVTRRHLRRLVSGDLVVRTTVNTVAVQSVDRPLFNWRPGKREPDHRRVSSDARSRWNRAPVPTEVYLASRRAANLFGSTAGHLPRVEQIDHDLLLAEVYVLYRRDRPAEADRWIGEDTLPKAGYLIKDPDAFLVSRDGVTTRVIESAGAYSSKQIESFHQHCLEQSLPYELW